MLESYEVTVQEDGRIELAEPVQLKGPRRAILTLLDDSQSMETTLFSEKALSDWNRPEEDRAWSHLQEAK